jgi:hypothetical protein
MRELLECREKGKQIRRSPFPRYDPKHQNGELIIAVGTVF